MNRGRASLLQGDFGEAWLHVVAAGAEMLHGESSTVDLDKADVEVTWHGEHQGTYSPTVKVQVKTSGHLRLVDDDYVYDLDVETYDVLRRTDHSVGRVLAVIRVAEGGEKVELADRGTILVGHGAWVSLEGQPPTTNAETVAVRLPKANTLERAGLERMLLAHGTRRTTVVPAVDVWAGVS